MNKCLFHSSTKALPLLIFINVFIVLLFIGHARGSGQVNVTQFNVTINQGSSSPYSQLFYDPPYGNISSNSNVTWTNKDTINHTVTFIGPLLKAGILGPADDVVTSDSNITFSFTEPGRYDYYCRFYPFMSGQIEVK